MLRITVAVIATALGCGWVGVTAAQTVSAAAADDALAWRPINPLDRPVLRYELSQRTRLVVQPAEQRVWGDAPGLPGSKLDGGVGIEFKSSRKNGLPPNLLRVQMTSKSTLQFRPRGGGLAVSYREQF